MAAVSAKRSINPLIRLSSRATMARFSYIPDISFVSVSFCVFSLSSFSVPVRDSPPSLLLSVPLSIFPAFGKREGHAPSDMFITKGNLVQ